MHVEREREPSFKLVSEKRSAINKHAEANKSFDEVLNGIYIPETPG